MPDVKIPDGGGATLTICDVDGFKIPAFPIDNLEEEFRAMRKWTLDESDIIISAYPKAGTHWIWEISNMLINRVTSLSKVNKEFLMMEALSKSQCEDLKSPRLFNTHVLATHLPEDLTKKKCKMIYIIRNPKDIAVSFFNHHQKILLYEFEGKWEHYVQRFTEGNVDYGSWFEYTEHWEQFIKDNPHHPIHVMHYEDLIENGIEEVGKLGKFLGVKEDPAFYEEVYNICQIDKMREFKNKNEDILEWRDNSPGMYRKGDVGDWKNWFTVAQSEYFDSVYADKMKTSDVQVRFEL